MNIVKSDNNKYLIHPNKGIYYVSKEFDRYINGDLSVEKKSHLERKYKLYKEFGLFTENKLKYNGQLSENQIIDSIGNVKNIIFEVTESCNLKCYYCCFGPLYKGNFSERKNRSLDLKKALMFVDYFMKVRQEFNVRSNVPLNISFYGGEPLLKIANIKKIIEYLENKYPMTRYTYSMTTNGTLIKKHIQFLVKKNFRLLISCDGDHIGNGYRRYNNNKESHTSIINNLIDIKNNHQSFYNNNIEIHSVIHDLNSPDSVKDYFRMTLSKIPKISYVSRDGICENLKNSELSIFKEGNKRAKSIDKADINNFLRSTSDQVKKSYLDFYSNPRSKKFLPTGTCIPFSKRVFITVDGKILQCEKINNQKYLGIITDKVEIDYQSICNEINNLYLKLSIRCESCLNFWNCTNCVFKNDLLLNGTCPDYIPFKSKNRKLTMILNYLEKNTNVLSEIEEFYVQ